MPKLADKVLRLPSSGRIWALGIIGAAITSALTAFATGKLKVTLNAASDYVAMGVCHLTEPKTPEDDSDFFILVSPLVGDKDGSQTRRLTSAFHGESFHVVRICDQVS